LSLKRPLLCVQALRSMKRLLGWEANQLLKD